jgi:alanine dehydrogenase
MVVGVPTETKDEENRVAMTPPGVAEFSTHDHRVVVQSGAGVGSAIADDDYRAARRSDRPYFDRHNRRGDVCIAGKVTALVALDRSPS